MVSNTKGGLKTVMATGILLHVYHLKTPGWQTLVWGNSKKDQLGTLTKFADCLLGIPAYETVESIVYSGPSTKGDLTEGAYARQYLVDRIDQLAGFFRLKQKIDRLSKAEYQQFIKRIHGLVTGPVIKNTSAEVNEAAHYFTTKRCTKIIQIASASHGPRCVQEQALAREKGIIPKEQQWHTILSETNHAGQSVGDVVIIEQPSRGDDPLMTFTPTLGELIKPFYSLTATDKKRFIRALETQAKSLEAG